MTLYQLTHSIGTAAEISLTAPLRRVWAVIVSIYRSWHDETQLRHELARLDYRERHDLSIRQ